MSDPICVLRDGAEEACLEIIDRGGDLDEWQDKMLAALAQVEQLVAAARPALELLASEGYDRHCGEYENLRSALLPFDDSDKEQA